MSKGVAVHFGGGNIGRGFVAECLHETGYEVVFVDVVEPLLEKINSIKSYTVTEVGDEGENVKTITNYRGLSSKTQEAEVIDEISKAIIVTCAVGPNVLKFIAPVIAKAIAKRTASKPLAVIACENAVNATDTLAGYIKDPKHMDEQTLSSLSKKAEFGNSAIDRIVPTQKPDAGLDVIIEKYFEWCVETTGFKTGHPDIYGVHWVDDLEPYIERKLYTVNTGHATAAYFGHSKGFKTIHECLEDKDIHDEVQEALSETSHLISNKHGITVEDQKNYVNSIVVRISNHHLEDVPDRVGRAPIRKLGRKERFIGPAAQLAERGEKVDALLRGVEMCLRFQNVEGDEESQKLAEILSTKSADEATTELTGLESSHPLYDRVVAVVKKVQGDKK